MKRYANCSGDEQQRATRRLTTTRALGKNDLQRLHTPHRTKIASLVAVIPALNVEFEALVSNTNRAAPEGAHVGKATVATYCHFLLDDELANAFVGVARRATTIVSLVPSASEAAAAILGDRFKSRVIGRSSYCDFPPSVSHLPVVSKSSLDLDEDMTGAEVEAKMREAKLRPSIVTPHVADVEFLRAYRPGVVVCQDSCPACGILEGTTHAALEAAGLDTGERSVAAATLTQLRHNF